MSKATAEDIVATLRAHQDELRAAGVMRLSLFGSLARGEATADSDIDLAAEFDPTARIDLLTLTALERRLGGLLGRPVDLLPEPTEGVSLQANIDRDRKLAF
jgi:predicted nucleotidyltransferase